MSTTERSLSRGRVGLQSSGRGGTGNIRAPSLDVDRVSGPDDFSDTRGRDPVPTRYLQVDEVTSTGRGGAGNIRSPSRDASRPESINSGSSPARSEPRGRGYDRDLISAIDTANDTGVHSSGRGGLGNITRPDSKSRSRSRDLVHSSGRGGIGNLYIGDPVEKGILEVEERERAAHQHPLGVHSTGRGGLANLTPGELPHVEAPVNPHGANHPHATHKHELESTGRGGAGNISDRSRSREPKEPNGKDHGLSGFLHRVTHTGAQKGEDEVLTTGVDTRQSAM
ncbi:hypothetical protein EDB92DRAFT_2088373 [Lactarius akahatsu]|uniref:Uncharacterized protein n=1 Tax=Lactarius akahatsu TaxID=416441 RepID=A0AAD4QDH0_9AGAM|nr:hypothetical protein EDB92DRAFT_2088373 [Lactarius akahatsu]